MVININIEELRIDCVKLLNVEIQEGDDRFLRGRIERYEKDSVK